ncbi:MAG: molybdate ABC transporter permease subunit [Chloroflexi bacterium]|nr:molybdate ABC transporter permease subunit [Chloroflexota bacterium]
MIWQPLIISLKVTAVATALASLAGLALALWFARRRFPGQSLAETLVSLPLVLPPTVVGFYLLSVLGNGGPLGRLFSINILFTWPAAALASAVMALPLMVRASKAAIEGVNPEVEKAARTLGSAEWEVMLRVTIPLARRGILAGMILAFARALGEFGATLMVAGNIPDKTQTIPLAIYDAVQLGRLDQANALVLAVTLVAFAVIWLVNRAQRVW